LAGLANTLINGVTNDQARASTYSARIGADTQAPALVLAQIVTDAQEARKGLGVVSVEAQGLLDSNTVSSTTRSDLMSYERALVRAQMAYRNFQTALGEVSARPEMDIDTAPVDKELNAFADEIDLARDKADALADKYASIGITAS